MSGLVKASAITKARILIFPKSAQKHERVNSVTLARYWKSVEITRSCILKKEFGAVNLKLIENLLILC